MLSTTICARWRLSATTTIGARCLPLALLCLSIVLPRPALADKTSFDGLRVHRQWVMGTMLTIAIEVPRGRSAEHLLQGAFSQVSEWDRLLSTFKVNSDLSRLNRQAGKGWLSVDRRVFEYLRRSIADARRTKGAFDITVGALTVLGRRPRPSDARRRAALALVGSRSIELASPNRVRLTRVGMRLDPGGNGKGVALDSVVAYLRKNGVRRAFIDFGGSSFYGLGAPKGRTGWPVLLTDAKKKPWRVVLLADRGLSMSHSAQQTSPGHVRYHIIDPRSGKRIHVWRAVALICKTATEADVLSTSLVVDPGLRAVLRREYPACAAIVFTTQGVAIEPSLRPRIVVPRR